MNKSIFNMTSASVSQVCSKNYHIISDYCLSIEELNTKIFDHVTEDIKVVLTCVTHKYNNSLVMNTLSISLWIQREKHNNFVIIFRYYLKNELLF